MRSASVAFFILITAIVLIPLFAPVTPARGALTWEFNTEGDAESWDIGCCHDLLRPYTVTGGILSAMVTGSDPYMCTLALSAPTEDLPVAHVRMRVGPGGGMLAALYWSTDQQPGMDESQKAEFTVAPDGEWHDYFIPLWQHASWVGALNRLRFDPPERGWPALVDIDFVRLGEGPALALSSPQMVALAGEPAVLRCQVVNAGPTAAEHISVHLSAPSDLAIAEPPTRMVGALASGADAAVTWHVTASAPGTYSCRADLAWPGGISASSTTLTVRAAPPPLSPDRPAGGQAYLADGHAVLENENLRLLFPQTSSTYDACVIFAWTNTGWRRVGAMAPLGHLAYRASDGRTHAMDVAATECVAENGALATLHFQHSVADVDGATWTFTAAYSTGSSDYIVAMAHGITPSLTRSLAHFSGPIVYAGDGAFGASKETAILSGLEWLESEECSSTTLDITTWDHYRIVPHPYKLTAGAMAVAGDGCLVGLIWDPTAPWDGTHANLAARFASPNLVEGGDNHLMQVFAPSPPSNVLENGVYAPFPVTIGPSAPVNLESHLVVEFGADAVAINEYWLSVYGPAQPSTMPRSIEEEIALCRLGWETLWDPASGWSHAVGWGHEPYPGFAALHWIDYLNSDDPAVRATLQQRVDTALDLMVAWWGEGGVVNTGGIHIFDWPFPFFKGHLDAGLGNIAGQANGILATQEADGSWRWSGGEFGTPGETAIGLCASNAMRLLRHARLTKNRTSLAAGLKALAFMDTFVVPRGAQTWEVPLHTPDILASGHAAGAYLEGYRITADPHYLERAVYWARTGLPFVYFWQAENRRDAMHGATIPVFGASLWTWSWLGRAVQWCGLVYAFHLNRLSDYDNSMDWRAIADSITVSGTHQQRSDGTYPDAFSLLDDTLHGVYINPEDIAKNVWWMIGVDPEFKTAVVRFENAAVHLSTQAAIDGAELVGVGSDTRLTAVLTYCADETNYAVVVGMRLPSSVSVDGRTLSSAADVDSVGEGWQYTSAGLLIIKAVHITAAAQYEITSPESFPPAPPADLQAVGYPDRVVLTWQANTEPDLSRYLIYRATATGGPYSYVGYCSKQATSYTDYLSSQGVTYYYVITARDSNLNESAYSNEASATPGDATPPDAVTDFTATGGESSVALAWTNPDADFVSTTIVYRADRFPTAIDDGVTVYQGAENAFADTNAPPGATAHYAAIASDAYGNCASPATAQAMPYETIALPEMGSGWHLVSLPWMPLDPDPAVVFGPNQVETRLYRYDTTAKGYVGYLAGDPGLFGDCGRGAGYWLYLDETSSLGYASLPEWSVQTIAAPMAGWHLIGHPWRGPVALARCLVRDVAANEVVALNDAAAAGWLTLPAYYWDRTAGSYGRCGGAAASNTTLEAWRGYWLLTHRPGLELLIPPP
ncbi:hypothetical protein AMK68_00755 [candidate division KD3-62 bacterium DG_56]|uniref:Fibronectin type-III domain-containing protein n=1 Tax=candidate division KD3-62 bacterium DG_56 TaxID=1704032 RepID=A0A0S7XQS9_9BACT|nr:MAG: hypothetical protein AMK68_00755 [candidate division KD3-62 bacterium DG_56]